jgi:hypothetical protein
METLDAAFDGVEARRKTLEVYADDAVGSELEAQFSTRNVDVVCHTFLPEQFVIVRDADGEFRGALGIDKLRAILSPEIHPPWTLSDADPDSADLFDFLDDTIFTAYDRRQMLAMAREIEDRAWRTDAGTLYAGFQNAGAFRAQAPVYDHFARESGVAVRVFVEDGWEDDVDLADGVEIVSGAGDEIGRFWFVLFDGAESDLDACGLLAEERRPDEYYGFWTYDPELLEEMISYLHAEYLG